MDEAFREDRGKAIVRYEHDYFTRLLTHTAGNQAAAARISGLSRATVKAMVERYQIVLDPAQLPDRRLVDL